MYDFCTSDFVIYYDTELEELHSDKSGFDIMSDIYVSKLRRHKLALVNNVKKRGRKYKIFKVTNDGKINYVRNCKPHDAKSNTQPEVAGASAERLINFHNYEVDLESDKRNSSRIIFERSSRFFTKPQIMSRFSNLVQSRRKYYRTQFKNLFIDSYGEPYCLQCEKRRIKKMNKLRFNYAFRSAYPDGRSHVPVDVGLNKGLRSPQYYNTKAITCRLPKAGLSSISILDSEFEYYPRLHKYNRRIQNYMLKEEGHAKKCFKNKKLQCPPKTERNQVIATPYWEESDSKNSDQNVSRCSVLPSTSSGFWEYLIEKIMKKQTGNECETTGNCTCQSGACAKNQESTRHTEYKTHGCIEKVPDMRTGSGSKECNLTNTINENIKSDTSHKICLCDCKNKKYSCKDAQTTAKLTEKPCNKGNKEETKEPVMNETNKSDFKKTDIENKPCRSPHDEVLKKLEKKYNGEILCIHNPPCILINGCLNLPSISGKQATPCWPVTQVKKPSMYNFYKKAKDRVCSEKQKTGKPDKYNESSSTSSSRCYFSSLNKNKSHQTFYQKRFCNLVKLYCKPKYGVCPQIPHTHVPTFRKAPKRSVQPTSGDHVQKSKYSQAIKSPVKINYNNDKNKTSIPFQSNTVMFTSSVEKAFLRPSSVAVYHKNKWLRMIQMRH